MSRQDGFIDFNQHAIGDDSSRAVEPTSAGNQKVSSRSKWKAHARLIGGGASVLVVCIVARYFWAAPEASAGPPSIAGPQAASSTRAAGAPGAATANRPQVVAIVNGEEIQRNDLARECLIHYGTEVLESLVNKHLIAQHCRQRGITVTSQEVDEEIDRMAKKFQLPTEQWMKMLKQERGISPEQYAEDIIWPTLALRKLAASKLTVSQQELDRAFDAEYGEAIQARLIVINDLAKAKQVHAKAKANPADFAALAKQHSSDVNSASLGGLVQPIRHHVGDKRIEQTAFAMKKDEISPVITVGDQHVILKCEGRIPPRRDIDPETVKARHAEAIRDHKVRTAAAEVFQQLQEETTIENVFNDPVKSQQFPGVAAIIDDHKVTIRELAEQCVDRHGIEVLEGTINRRLLEQALARDRLTIEDSELVSEIARAAIAVGKLKASGEPDIEGWFKMVTEQQKITRDQYVRDAVWPTVALKKLVGQVPVTDEDVEKGFEANYGPRVRCRAIVLGSQRKAQEVWGLARENPSVEYFAKLAEQYSIEPGSKALGGEIPPIQRHGGQPTIEEEAFKLKAGQLSSVIQVADKFVVLLCEGLTEPVKVDIAEVRDEIYQDIHEKKIRVAMADKFTELKDTAQIENYLAGTTQMPKARQNRDISRTPGGPPPSKSAAKGNVLRQPISSAVRQATHLEGSRTSKRPATK